MKPVAFDYYRPTSVEEVHALLASHGGGGKILAGGQSLVPLLNMRLARPAAIIDINRVAALEYLHANGDGLVLGALTRQQSLLENRAVAERYPLLVEAVRYIGHRQIRNWGTVGGSLAHADPAAELPVTMVALDAEITASSARGARAIPAREFFLDTLTTALEPDELLASVRLPALSPGTGWSFLEVSRRHGDFALVAVAALVTRDEAGVCTDARLVLGGVGPVPQVVEVRDLLIGQQPTPDAIAAAADVAGAVIEPASDVHATAEYRRHVARVLARRALTTAVERAGGRR
ncbi:xanthine dehydrogenase family protein subunit M [Thermomicrobiaceae bacterium CFH 74404]|uniref:Xanthine dehydrogenase family protein subunit M n=1 Tax=Thermalbibacter longus TaxID=2951981 RepID=A0AA41WFS3_9BACT|nr:xanthine dehydrogenase family protein subunit M [Thermalbibacter longus]MCM8749293.1 xanthine dehydrogenase family protein subunit M [Thermalbibacter longus]